MGQVPPLLSKIDGRFQNAIVGALGVKGSNVTPQQVDLSHVAPTLDVGGNGWGGAIPFIIGEPQTSSALGTTWSSDVAGPTSSILPLGDVQELRNRTDANGEYYSITFDQLENINYAACIRGGTVRYVYTSGGNVTDAGNVWHTQLLIQDTRNNVEVFLMSNQITITAIDGNYNVNFNGVAGSSYAPEGIGGQNPLPIPVTPWHRLTLRGATPDGTPASDLTLQINIWGELVPLKGAMPLV